MDRQDRTEESASRIYPKRCCFCGRVVEYGVFVCEQCKKEAVKITGARCFGCGSSAADCKCKGRSNFYKGITAPYVYKGVVRHGIHRWKYGGAEQSVVFFAKAAAACVRRDFPTVSFDCVTFVPQTRDEWDERGYNQGESLAARLARELELKTERLLIKTDSTHRQHDLPGYRKSGNVFGVFDCCQSPQVQGLTVLLADDVGTSRATLNECAKMLRLHGAEMVYCVVIAVA